MAIYNKVNSFVLGLGTKLFNLSSDSLKLALTNTAHTSTWTKLSDLTEITYTNLSSRALTTTSYTQSSGTAKLILADLVLTSTGGTTGPFRYFYIYDDTATNKDLIGYYDYGSAVTLANGDTLTVDFDNVNGVFTIA